MRRQPSDSPPRDSKAASLIVELVWGTGGGGAVDVVYPVSVETSVEELRLSSTRLLPQYIGLLERPFDRTRLITLVF